MWFRYIIQLFSNLLKFQLFLANFRYRAEGKKVTSRAEPSWTSFSSSSGSRQLSSVSLLSGPLDYYLSLELLLPLQLLLPMDLSCHWNFCCHWNFSCHWNLVTIGTFVTIEPAVANNEVWFENAETIKNILPSEDMETNSSNPENESRGWKSRPNLPQYESLNTSINKNKNPNPLSDQNLFT